MNPIKVLLVDDHFIVRAGIKMILETIEGYEVVAEADNGQEALTIIEKEAIDLILLDMLMPVMDGLTTLSELKKREISIPVVILTTVNEDQKIKTAIERGAKSYLLKDATRDMIKRTIDAAINDEMLLTATIQASLLKPSNQPAQEEESLDVDFGLTERELFILKEVAKGETNKGISIDMNISERTVKAHLTNIYQKMGVASRSEAVATAIANKVIHL